MREPTAPRVATTADAGEVARLLVAFNRDYDTPVDDVATVTPRVVRHVEEGLSVFLLAGPPDVGVAQLRFREYVGTGEGICYLEELYVVEPRRGEGHGRAMMELAFDVARDQGAGTIELTTSWADVEAVGLYRALGFTNLEVPGDERTSMIYFERDL